jgi:catechol 2,3-dioxygenase-like lactoylglutathione lyase family enzyme
MSDPFSTGLAGRRLVQVALPSRDLARSIGFYRDVLGLPLLFEVGGMAFFQAGEVRLMLGSNSPNLDPGKSNAVYFDAPDLPTLGPELERRGVVFDGIAETLQRTDAGDLMLRFFRDPDGNAIGLMGIVPRA